MEGGSEFVSRFEILSGCDDLSIGVGGDGEASCESGLWAERAEEVTVSFDSLLTLVEGESGARLELMAELLESLLILIEVTFGRIVCERSLELLERSGLVDEASGVGLLELEREIV